MPRRNDIKKVMIIGSGPIVIGQACEFDYSGTQACKALRGVGYEIVLANSNPATIMTDPGMADVTYIEPLNFEAMKEIVEKERPDALLPNLGGQSGLNLSSQLYREGVLDEYGVAGRVIHTPGHTHGSVSVLLDSGEAIVGDAVMAKMMGLIRKPGHPFIAWDLAQNRDSVRRLLALSPHTVYVGHGGPFATEDVSRLVGR